MSPKKKLLPSPVASDSGHGHQGTWSTTGFNLHNVVLGKGKFPKSWTEEEPIQSPQLPLLQGDSLQGGQT